MTTTAGRAAFFLLCLIARVTTASLALSSTGLSVILDTVYYFVSPFPSGQLDVPRGSLSRVPDVVGFRPVTVVQDRVSSHDISRLLTNWTTIDDVYRPAFSTAIFLSKPKGGKRDGAPEIIETKIFEDTSTSLIQVEDIQVPSGPYFLEVATGKLYPVYRLYEDFAGAFTESLIQTPDGRFQPLSAKIPGSASLTIGVPSRLYSTKTTKKPLAGVRIGVKDIYRLAGVKGSNGNRAWYSLYPPSNATASAIQKLIDAGAQVVGLQKTSQFANGEVATDDWVDYHAPFNPRGDGYQDPAASSAGAGASVASYEWLDIAIGSDTGGSIRAPAAAQGLFGNRPSHGLAALDHVMPLAPALDTPGFIVRDPYLWDTANTVLYGSNYTSLSKTKPTYPTKIFTLSFPTDAVAPADKVFIDFANTLAEFVHGTVTALDLEAEWAATKPAGAGNTTLAQFLNTTYPTIISKEQTTLVRDPFYHDYAAAHNNRRPFINPVPLSRWAYGDSLPPSALQDAYAAKALFATWFNTHILPTTTSPSTHPGQDCSAGLLLYPNADGSAFARNVYRSPPGPPFGFSEGRISPFAGVPDVVWPVGEVAGVSAVTGVQEVLPVAVDAVAPRGCDGVLVRLAQELVERGVVRVPRVGRSGLDGGEVLVRRG